MKGIKLIGDSMIEVFDGIGYYTKPLSSLIEKKEIEVNQNEKKAILDFSFDMVNQNLKRKK